MKKNYPYIWGVQYYRAPTPERDSWNSDLKKIKEIGFNSVKFWVQWRWSHIQEDKFYFDDLDELMDLAQDYGLDVTLNIILDVAPVWLYEKYSDAKMILNDGTVVEPVAVQHRQIGGHPGPCYNHPGANEEKRKFLEKVFLHFKDHPALAMWDVWNEPELCYPQRFPVKTEKLACYCDNCRREFRVWLENKYKSIDRLNHVWGRNYSCWNDAEMPRSESVITDFVDWREFQGDSMTKDAKLRLELAHRYSPDKISYLHVVPNDLQVWNPVSCCSDDFDMAKNCDVFASTMTGSSYTPQLVLSAGRGKVCYNVESHINCGHISMHQRSLALKEVNRDLLPQIGMGIKGFMFWQYRAELLGTEAPCWGIVNPDGTDRSVTEAVRRFGAGLLPVSENLMKAFPQKAEIGIWKSRKNELFHYCGNKLDSVHAALENYSEILYRKSYRYSFVNSFMLENGELDDYKMIIMPCPYYLTEAEAEALNKWVADGGVLLAEAHLGGYNADTGRHSTKIPGMGLSELWNFREEMSCSSYHLDLQSEEGDCDVEIQNDDLRKALQESALAGGKFFPISYEGRNVIWGAWRYAELTGQIEMLGSLGDSRCSLGLTRIGQGMVYYAGTELGCGAEKDYTGLARLIDMIAAKAKVCSTLNCKSSDEMNVHVDALFSGDNDVPEFIVISNKDNQPAELELNILQDCHCAGIFSEMNLSMSTGCNNIEIPADFIDLFVVK